MANAPSVLIVPTLVNQDTIYTNGINSVSVPRVLAAPFPINLAGGGGSNDPVGPQRWPVKL